jgi:hypothetical protein
MISGGKSSNEISIAFQLADWRDGWKIVDEKTGEPIDMGGEDGKDGKGGGEGGKGGGASGKGGTGSGSGAGGGAGSGGKGGAGGGKGADLNDKEVNNMLSLLQRVIRLEDEVGIGPGSKG